MPCSSFEYAPMGRGGQRVLGGLIGRAARSGTRRTAEGCWRKCASSPATSEADAGRPGRAGRDQSTNDPEDRGRKAEHPGDNAGAVAGRLGLPMGGVDGGFPVASRRIDNQACEERNQTSRPQQFESPPLMAKKSTKATATSTPQTDAEVPNPAQEPAAPSSNMEADDLIVGLAKIKAEQNGLAGLSEAVARQKAKLHEAEAECDAAKAKIEQLQIDLIAKYPKAKDLFDDATVSKRGGTRKGARSGSGKKSGPVLDRAQAEQVLAALPSSFQLSDFKTKTAELFPDRIGKGALKLLADKVKDAGGKGMGRRYKKV